MKKAIRQGVNTQSERMVSALKKVKIDATAKDRAEAASALSLSRITIHNYLNGKVRDNDTAVKIIEFFNQKIAERENVIS